MPARFKGQARRRHAKNTDLTHSLEWLIAPISEDQFLKTIFCKEPLRVARDSPDYYENLMTEQDLEFALLLGSRTRGVVDILSADGNSRIAKAYGDAIQAVHSGSSLRISGISRLLPKLLNFSASLRQQFGSFINVNMYLSPPSSKALGRHYDTHDVFVLQVAGSKIWRTFDQPVEYPLEYMAPLRGESPRHVRKHRLGRLSRDTAVNLKEEFTLNAGDVLYLPRGHWHEAQATPESTSCHLTIGLQPYTYLDLFTVALSDIAEKHSDLRLALPLNFNGSMEAQEEVARHAASIVQKIGDSFDSSHALQAISTIFEAGGYRTLKNNLFGATGASVPTLNIANSNAGSKSLKTHIEEDGKGWLPIKLEAKDRSIQWLAFGNDRLPEPFFRQSISRLKSSSASALTRTTPLRRLRTIHGGMPPAGFIFHISRCGSTLISNALKCFSEAVVFSEPEALGDALMVGQRITDPEKAQGLVKSVVEAFGMPRRPEVNKVLFKTSSWNVLFLETFRKIWPDVPFLYVIREPTEVMVSCLDGNPGWMKWQSNRTKMSRLFGKSEEELSQFSREEFCAHALSAFMNKMDRNLDPMTRVINYKDLNQSSLIRVAEFFGLNASEADKTRIMESMSFYSKDLGRARLSTNDSDEKQRAVTADIRDAAERLVMNSYNNLNAKSIY